MATGIEPFYPALGRRVQKLRRERKMTQEDLGRRLTPPMTRASIANIETGKQRVLAHTLVELANILGVKVLKLIPKSARGITARLPSDELGQQLATVLPISAEQVQDLVTKLEQEEQA